MRPLSMREVPGSIPGFSSDTSFFFLMITTIFVITEILFFIYLIACFCCFVLFCFFYQRLTAELKDLIILLNQLQIVIFFCDAFVLSVSFLVK